MNTVELAKQASFHSHLKIVSYLIESIYNKMASLIQIMMIKAKENAAAVFYPTALLNFWLQ